MTSAAAVIVPAAAIGWFVIGKPAFPAEAIGLSILSGALEAAYFGFLAAAYRRGDLSVVYPIALQLAARPAATPSAGFTDRRPTDQRPMPTPLSAAPIETATEGHGRLDGANDSAVSDDRCVCLERSRESFWRTRGWRNLAGSGAWLGTVRGCRGRVGIAARPRRSAELGRVHGV
jgi:hypothetical protein